MLTDDDKCPNCGGPITWGTDEDWNAVSYMYDIKPILYSYITCENHCGWGIHDWAVVDLYTFVKVKSDLEEMLEEKYRAIFERSWNQQDRLIRDSKLETRESRAAELREQLDSFKW